MFEVQIPDQIYRQAVKAAEAGHVTPEEFIAEVLENHFRDLADQPSVRLTTEQISIVRQSQAEIKAGRGLTLQEVQKRLDENRVAWLKTNHQP